MSTTTRGSRTYREQKLCLTFAVRVQYEREGSDDQHQTEPSLAMPFRRRGRGGAESTTRPCLLRNTEGEREEEENDSSLLLCSLTIQPYRDDYGYTQYSQLDIWLCLVEMVDTPWKRHGSAAPPSQTGIFLGPPRRILRPAFM